MYIHTYSSCVYYFSALTRAYLGTCCEAISENKDKIVDHLVVNMGSTMLASVALLPILVLSGLTGNVCLCLLYYFVYCLQSARLE